MSREGSRDIGPFRQIVSAPYNSTSSALFGLDQRGRVWRHDFDGNWVRVQHTDKSSPWVERKATKKEQAAARRTLRELEKSGKASTP